eukprot:scaffold454_cov25-Tisochrysis_lutea.AAC.2
METPLACVLGMLIDLCAHWCARMLNDLCAHWCAQMLNDLFASFDDICDRHGVYHVDTIGDG